MKFAHIADCHLGGWREETLRNMSLHIFERAVSRVIAEKVDFVLFCGDLFNTALPSHDSLHAAISGFVKLRDHGIPVYLIAGSHDYSSSGKSWLDLLEPTKIFVNVAKVKEDNGKLKVELTHDPKTGVALAGMLGKRGGLETEYYKMLSYDGGHDRDKSIFLFHSALEELKEEDMQAIVSQPLSLLPTGFWYYAGGHVHRRLVKDVASHGRIVYPGPLFPNNFKELEETTGGFYIVNDGEMQFIENKEVKVVSVNVSCEGKKAEDVRVEVETKIEKIDVAGKIVLFRMSGQLREGSLNEIQIPELMKKMYDCGAFQVLRHSAGLHVVEFQEVKVSGETVGEIEQHVIAEHKDQISVNGFKETQVNDMLNKLGIEKIDGETVKDFNDRVIKVSEEIFGK